MATTASVPYVLGVSEDEVRRLIEQSDLYRDATEDALRRAGIEPGMRVLDVGTGAGGVAILDAQLVGPSGSVTAVDASTEMLAVASARAAMHGIGTISFTQADLATWEPDGRYDAVTGRLILMHLADPAAVVRRLAGAVRPGGVVVFSDFVMTAARQVPAGALFDETFDRIHETFRRAGRPLDMGIELGRVFRAAGLPSPRLQLGGVVGEGAAAAIYSLLAGVTRTLLPRMIQAGIVAAGQVDVATLAERLAAEAVALDAVCVPPLLGSAWCRVGELGA